MNQYKTNKDFAPQARKKMLFVMKKGHSVVESRRTCVPEAGASAVQGSTGYSYSNFGSAPPHSGEELGWTLLPTENARGGVLEGAPPQNGFQV